MTPQQFDIQLIASLSAVACALPGVFLVLRRMAMMSDAISHAILVGIVLAFFAVKDLSSPILLIAAAATGVLTVALVEMVSRTKLLKEDASMGIVFPVLFSIGVILISRYSGNIHLDTDSVLLGELALAPFDRLVIGGHDIGPLGAYTMGGAVLLNLAFIILFYKELKLSTFDPGLAAAIGFSPALLHYSHMALVSVTAVGAFDVVGSILVVALMVAPPASAYLLTDRLPVMILLASLFGIASAILGFWTAVVLDASIAGTMASWTGIIFLLVFLFAPDRGIVAMVLRRHRQRGDFALRMLVVHLLQHENEPNALDECRIDHLQDHFRWDQVFAGRIIKLGKRRGVLSTAGDKLVLQQDGRVLAQRAVSES